MTSTTTTERRGGIEPYPADLGRQAFGFPGALTPRLLRRREFRLLRSQTPLHPREEM